MRVPYETVWVIRGVVGTQQSKRLLVNIEYWDSCEKVPI
jgi:hypothetical protein